MLDLQTSTSCKSSKNHEARIITNSSFDTLSRLLIAELGCQNIEELIGNESKTMVSKSLNDLAPQCLCNQFTKSSACSSLNLQNTETDMRLPKKQSANGQICFSYQGAKIWKLRPKRQSSGLEMEASFSFECEYLHSQRTDINKQDIMFKLS